VKCLILDTDAESMGLDVALRAQDAGHEVRYWLPDENGALPYGDGLVEKVTDWDMNWPDLIVTTGNSTYGDRLEEYFEKGYPIFGANLEGASLELDRAKGQEVLSQCGIKTIPYTIVDSAEEAIELIRTTDEPYAMKPHGGEADKALTCVASTPDEAIFTIQKWEKDGKFPEGLMMQERVDGVEMGIAGWFGPAGWNAAIEESFEHKKLMVDDYGPNTGEMGTVLRHVSQSKLFDLILEPLTDYLHSIKYVGCCSVNCIIDRYGNPMPLEFTNRLGWPSFCITQEIVQGDPIQWMLDLLHWTDTLQVSTKVAMGVLLAHGDFPSCEDPADVWTGFPITGITDENYSHLHFQQVCSGTAPKLIAGKIKEVNAMVTAGTYVLIAGGSGKSVSEARDATYAVAKSLDWPSDLMLRTDIGVRLKKDLPIIQDFGYAEGMVY